MVAAAALVLPAAAGCGGPQATVHYMTGGPDETVAYDLAVFQLARGGKKAKEKYQIGEELELRVLRIDLEHRRIALSERALDLEAEPLIDEMQERPERGRGHDRDRERGRERWREEDLNDKFTLEDHLREFEEERDLEG